ncbi:cobalt ECF transporter T component CbiQ [Halalkaliarchaeum sp. AArc-GB]|uniref:cobalt ECF transporter T component CbiQ n=1 Tax=Halalkaliarchaeum sp. AArc-GB TaxID=3074078 RepID=UPI0028560599|nr:cobalt ECF transporter T component CbiQ [Halalkaliarchaeum sp. AArc-GB]MDR5673752.1 cobalt ECF transporter T component CbiQ [Halalkaliarchaeum sp. AArc-GB]
MHETLERVQVTSSPAIDGPLKVYVALLALALAVASPVRTTQVACVIAFTGLAYHAAGSHALRLFAVPVTFLVPGLAVVLIVTPGGETLAEFWFVSVTESGIETALNTGLRSLASLSVLGFLVSTTPVPELFAALRRLRLPAFVVEMSLLVYRGIQLLLEEADRLRAAAAARLGFLDRGTTVRSTKLIAGSLLVRSLDRAERLDDAMQARGYDGRMPTGEYNSCGHGYAAVVLGALIVTVVP